MPHAAPLARTVAVALLSVTALVAQERPLPNQESFLREVRTRLQTDSSLQSSYIYVETRREQKLDGRGRVEQESVKVYESYPGLPGEDRWERLISENGRPRRCVGPGEGDARPSEEGGGDGPRGDGAAGEAAGPAAA